MVLLCVGEGGVWGMREPQAPRLPQGGAVRFKNTRAQAAGETAKQAEC